MGNIIGNEEECGNAAAIKRRVRRGGGRVGHDAGTDTGPFAGGGLPALPGPAGAHLGHHAHRPAQAGRLPPAGRHVLAAALPRQAGKEAAEHQDGDGRRRREEETTAREKQSRGGAMPKQEEGTNGLPSEGVGAPGDGQLGSEGPDRGAAPGEAAADGDAQPPPAHLHREDRQRQNPRGRGQPPAGAAVRPRPVKMPPSAPPPPPRALLMTPAVPRHQFTRSASKRKTHGPGPHQKGTSGHRRQNSQLTAVPAQRFSFVCFPNMQLSTFGTLYSVRVRHHNRFFLRGGGWGRCDSHILPTNDGSSRLIRLVVTLAS